MLEALEFAMKAIGEFCDVQEKLIAQCDVVPMDVPLHSIDEALRERVFSAGADKMRDALHNPDKHARMDAVGAVKEEVVETFSDEEMAADGKDIRALLKALEKKTMRTMVLEEGERADGRKLDEVRQVTTTAGYLPRAHGSGLFTRGQTQVLSVLTLGMLSEWQRLDTIDVSEGKRYMHHYNFPPFSVGETGFMRGPKRRDIGHGALAERALVPVLPAEEDFPYTIRIVSEVLESNGSSSMGSVCGSSLALMDAGVPISAPVSGIAMGLIKEGDDVAILTDIQGLEDFLGDMDFKVAGTAKGITALQMDNKAKGLSMEILSKALMQAKEGRAHILGIMMESIDTPREELSQYAPAHPYHQDPDRQDPRRHRFRWQGHPRHPGRDRRSDRHPGGRHHLHRRPRPRWRRGQEAHRAHRQGARDRREVHRSRRLDPELRRIHRAHAGQGRSAPHLSRGQGPREHRGGRPQRRRRGRGRGARCRRQGQDLARSRQQAGCSCRWRKPQAAG